MARITYEKKLSKAQIRAYKKLTAIGQSAYTLRESIATLNALVAMGLATKDAELGSIFDSRTGIKYCSRLQ
ncbi:hypothetical protein LCGC14_0529040 [marine sediment metagenome]|uniref:Uncharacterized protein n=1 Tax=marine sediment metagenome TaxID=412755 RepID=A0A0F9RW85_9ZZZZ